MSKRGPSPTWLAALGAALAIVVLVAGLTRSREVSVDPDPVTSGERPAAPTSQPAGPLALLGELRLTRSEDIADVAAYNDLALLGTYCGASGGAHIVDISTPERPAKLAETPAHTNTSAEDLQAARIGERDVLALGLQNCGRRSMALPHRGDPSVQGLTGLELVDISDPRSPEQLSFFQTDAGVHEFDIMAHADGRTLALLALPRLEQRTAEPDGQGGTGDLMILDISDPLSPTMVAEWGLLGAPELGPEVFEESLRGQLFDTLLHSVRAGDDGRLAYLSYWDAGVIILDLADPARPQFVGRIPYAEGEEGNAHSVAEADGGRILVVADEDITPYDLRLESSALPGPADAFGLGATKDTRLFRERPLAGTLLDAGLLCDGESASGLSGMIALVEDGACGIGTKIALAQRAGAKGVVIYSAVERRGAPAPESSADIDSHLEVELPEGGHLRLMIPALFVQREVGLQLLQPELIAVKTSVSFGGYGALRLYDIGDPTRPRALSSFATPGSQSEERAVEGWWTAHNPEVVGDTLYASWYHDGLWAIDISDPATPRPLGSWDGGERLVFIWGVVPHGDLLLASDIGFGLYVFRGEG